MFGFTFSLRAATATANFLLQRKRLEFSQTRSVHVFLSGRGHNSTAEKGPPLQETSRGTQLMKQTSDYEAVTGKPEPKRRSWFQ